MSKNYLKTMDEIERRIRHNVGMYIEEPWTIIESYFNNQLYLRSNIDFNL